MKPTATGAGERAQPNDVAVLSIGRCTR